MKFLFKILVMFIAIPVFSQQLYQGPADGFTGEGVKVTLSTMSIPESGGSGRFKLFNKFPDPVLEFPPADRMPAGKPEGSNEITVPVFNLMRGKTQTDESLIISSFEGIEDAGTNIPPDPYIAVGTTQIIQTVNSRFRISDKKGNTLKTLSADNFFGVLGIRNLSAFDPKVIFDQYENRWVMLWDQADDALSEAYLLLAVSETDDALGNWYLWALPVNVNGSTPDGVWCDYPGIGYDDKAIYLCGNYLTFPPYSTSSVKLKILLKEDIYSNSTDPLTYRDFWDITYPGTGILAWGLRPARMLSQSNEFLMISAGRYNTNNDIAIYKVSPDLNTISAFTVPVTAYRSAPNANQLGGGSLLLETGNFNFRNEPVYQNGILHAVHSVGGGGGSAYGYLRYLAIDIDDRSAKVDFSMGANNYWYTYPALAVDADNNVFFSYSRSSTDEYIGAYYTTLKAGNSTPSASGILQTGKGNYVRDYNQGRNRWGDYMGAWIDPVDPYTIWVMAEYAAGTNIWGNWVAGLRLKPLPGVNSIISESEVDFGDTEIGFESEKETIIIESQGDQPLVISNISVSDPSFVITTDFSLPLSLNFKETLNLDLKFVPNVRGDASGTVTFTTNDPDYPAYSVDLKAKGYVITPAVDGIIYASSNNQTRGSLFTLHSNLGTGTLVGETGFGDVSGISINPLNNEIFGIVKGSSQSRLIRINSKEGDAYNYLDIPLVIKEIEFDTEGTLYGISDSDELYTIKISDGSFSKVGAFDKSVTGLAINPLDRQLWAAMSDDEDKGVIYTVDKTDASYQIVGKTNFDYDINELAFDKSGNLFGLYTEIFILKPSNFISINTADGSGELIGSIGKKGIVGLAIKGDTLTTSVNNNISSDLPAEYRLEQNYPNPFNPSTIISFSIPKDSQVKISVYNLLGEMVAEIVDDHLKAGEYSFELNTNNTGADLSSGVYFYKMEAGQFVSTRKMLLLK